MPRRSGRGQPQRDAHLRSADFLDVENHPRITFKGNQVEVAGPRDYTLRGALMIRGVSREVELNVSYLGEWLTPWWEEEGGKWRGSSIVLLPLTTDRESRPQPNERLRDRLRILRVICLALGFESLRQSQGAALEGARGLDLGKG